MTHTYHISGMTCGGCKTKVENALNNIKNITKASVDLDQAEAVIHMSSHVPLKQLQEALGNKYTIEEVVKTNVFKSTEIAETPNKWQQLKPLFLIFGYLFAAAFLLNRDPWNAQGFMLDFMGLFYIVFSFFKLLDLKNFPTSFSMYDPIAKRIPMYGWIYPFIEVGLGLLFLFRFQVELALVLTLIILGFTTYGVTQSLLRKQQIQCACLGTVLKLPMTQATFIENAIMIVMAIIMLLNTTAL